ncbi:hypothetical protein ACGFNU_29820 [Spirillospora sp. NPDC048911]|uniref:hypothetical protein n=1 Tax=Spirillospora sp. NPDC048911 TaxID=3364527 RepID=UPI003713C557
MSPHDDPGEFPADDPADRTVTLDLPNGFTIPVEVPVRDTAALPAAQPDDRYLDHPIDEPIDRYTDQPTSERTGQPAGQFAGESVEPLTDSPLGGLLDRPEGQPAAAPDKSAAPTAPAGSTAAAAPAGSTAPVGSAGPAAPGASGEPGKRGRVREVFASTGALLLTLTALPAIALALPNTSLNVLVPARDALGLADAGLPNLIRAAGLTLPALLFAVPLAAVAARRFSPRLVLLIGLMLLLGGLGAARLAATVPMVAGGRVAQGLGAGIALPAVLVLVWERQNRALAAIWAGTLAAALIVAMPLALRATPLPGGGAPPGDWRVAFGPYPGVAAAALAAAFLCVIAASRRLPAARRSERGQLLLPAIPTTGFAFLGVVTTYGWSPGAQLVVGGIAMIALLGLAMAGGHDATIGSPLGCAVVMVTTGLISYPLAGPMAGLANASAAMRDATSDVTGVTGDPRLYLVPFAAAAAAALLGALGTVRMSRDTARGAVLCGHGLAIVAVLVCLATDVTSDPWLLLAPLVPLGAGLGMALAASLRDAGVGAALFGLTLSFPAVLVGQLLVLSLQAGQIQRLRPQTGEQQLYGLTAGFRVWLIAAGVLTVVLVAVCLRVTAARDRGPRAEGRRRARGRLRAGAAGHVHEDEKEPSAG